MFEYAFGLKTEAEHIRKVVNESLNAGIVTEDIVSEGKAYRTSEVGEWICNKLNSK
jgi:3-isopropylmalate dehydrogenase